MSNTLAIVMAAGKGTRMKSDLPKVLIPVCGRPMIDYVVDALEAAGLSRTVVVVGYRGEDVRQALEAENIEAIVLTGFVGTYGKEAIRRGAQDYLNKGSITASLLERALCYAIERHQHQAQLVMANVELERFAGAVAHDLTKPITAIAGFAQTLERLVPSLDDNARLCVEGIVDNVDQASNMIRDLLGVLDVAPDGAGVE